MMRSLWTAASGMTGQQQNIDTISNNLANVNTVGYKKERLEFKSLMYETMERANLDEANRTNKPVNLQVGHGIKPSATSRIFSTGSIDVTDYPLDFAIEGNGFFVADLGNDRTGYTKDGTFKISSNEDGNTIVTSDGFYILGVDGEPITFANDLIISEIVVASNGMIFAKNDEGIQEDTGFQINIVQFPNMQGLEAIGGNMMVVTSASGEPMLESEGEVNDLSNLIQGALEMSNVAVADEMINLIVAQRAYELNSKAITTSDEMLQLANNMKR
jgi:flagellar basal-body rod protein FlgG